jgi:hypothetical protein
MNGVSRSNPKQEEEVAILAVVPSSTNLVIRGGHCPLAMPLQPKESAWHARPSPGAKTHREALQLGALDPCR